MDIKSQSFKNLHCINKSPTDSKQQHTGTLLK